MDDVFKALGRPEPPGAARPSERAQRPDAARALPRPRHGPPVGEQAPRGARGGEPRHHRAPRAGRSSTTSTRRPINEIADRWITPLRPGPGGSPRRPETRTGGHRHDHSDHARRSSTRPTSAPRPSGCGRRSPNPPSPRRYWDIDFETDWQPGSPMTWGQATASTIADPEQVVLEADPPRRLSYTWHTFTPEWAAAVGFERRARARSRPSPVRRSCSRSSPIGAARQAHGRPRRVRRRSSTVLQMISGGWPRVVGAMKTLLETGDLDDGYAAGAVVGRARARGPRRTDHARGTRRLVDAGRQPEPAVLGGELTFASTTSTSPSRVEHVEPPRWSYGRAPSRRISPNGSATTVWFDAARRATGRALDIDFVQVGLLPTCDCFDVCPGVGPLRGELGQASAAGDGGQPRGSAEWDAARVTTGAR